jgi:predicted nuclease with TOPRIM domain
MGFEFDWKLVWSVIQAVLSLIVAALVFIMGKVFIKKEPFDSLNNRVQTIEQTYVQKESFDELKTRVQQVEHGLAGLPELVKRLNDEIVDLKATARHMNETIKRVERPIQLIMDAAMRGKNDGSK